MVYGTCGEYEDQHWWNIKAFSNKDVANNYVNSLTRDLEEYNTILERVVEFESQWRTEHPGPAWPTHLLLKKNKLPGREQDITAEMRATRNRILEHNRQVELEYAELREIHQKEADVATKSFVEQLNIRRDWTERLCSGSYERHHHTEASYHLEEVELD